MPKRHPRALYMDFARAWAAQSRCERLQVGTVITTADYRNVVGIGYNGGASGQEDDCHRGENGEPLEGGCGHLHSEINAIISCTYLGPKKVFVTTAPCPMCAKALVNFAKTTGGIETLYFEQKYRDHSGLQILNRGGIATICLVDGQIPDLPLGRGVNDTDS